MKKNVNYDVLKVLATLFVVISHISVMYSSLYSAYEMNENALLNWLSIFLYSFHMPLFVFISGAIYKICIKNDKYKSFTGFIKTKAKRLLIPYLFVGICYVTPVMLLLKLTDSTLVQYVIKGILLCQNSRHLWYLPVLFMMFIITRSLKPVFSKYPKTEYILLLFTAIIAMFLYNYFPTVFALKNFAKNYVFFLLGYLFCNKIHIIEEAPFKKSKYSIVLITFVIINILLMIHPDRFRLFTGILGIIMCYSFTIIIKDYFIKTRFYMIILKNSMGIYLFHPMIIYVIFSFGIKWNINPFLFSILTFCISLIGSIGLTKLLHLVSLNHLIGE